MVGSPANSEPGEGSAARRRGRPPNPGTKWWDDLRDIDVSHLGDSPAAAWETNQPAAPGWDVPPEQPSGHIWGRGRARSGGARDDAWESAPPAPPTRSAPPPSRSAPPPTRSAPPPSRSAPPPAAPPAPYREPSGYQSAPPPGYKDVSPVAPPYRAPEPPPRRPAAPGDRRSAPPRGAPEGPPSRGPMPSEGPQVPGWGAPPAGGSDATDTFPAIGTPAEPYPQEPYPREEPYPPQESRSRRSRRDRHREPEPPAGWQPDPPGRRPAEPGYGDQPTGYPAGAPEPVVPEEPEQKSRWRWGRKKSKPEPTAPPAAARSQAPPYPPGAAHPQGAPHAPGPQHTQPIPRAESPTGELPAVDTAPTGRHGAPVGRHDEPTGRHGAPTRPGPGGPVDPGGPGAGRPAAPTEAIRRATPGPDVAPIPFSAVRSGVAALAAVVLATVLVFGSRLDPTAYAAVCFAVQALFVAAWTLGGKPPGPQVVGAVGIIAAIGADLAAVYSPAHSLAPLGYVVAGAFVLGVIGQLVRGGGRARVTESIGAVAVVTVGVVALATPVLLSRYPAGSEALLACLLAAGVGLLVARVSDMVIHQPRVSPQVPRGAVGVVLGAMAGTAVAGWAGSVVVSLTPGVAAVVGVVVAVAAVLADLGMVFAETGRLLAGDDGSRWLVRAMLGPLVALAVAAPAAYLLSVLMIVKGF